MNDEAVCRRAPATLGLSNSLLASQISSECPFWVERGGTNLEFGIHPGQVRPFFKGIRVKKLAHVL